MRSNELKTYVSHLYEEGRRAHEDLRDAELPKALISYLRSGDMDDAFHTLMQLKQGAKIYAWKTIDKLLTKEAGNKAENEREKLRRYRGRPVLSETDSMIASHSAEIARNCNSSLHSIY